MIELHTADLHAALAQIHKIHGKPSAPAWPVTLARDPHGVVITWPESTSIIVPLTEHAPPRDAFAVKYLALREFVAVVKKAKHAKIRIESPADGWVQCKAGPLSVRIPTGADPCDRVEPPCDEPAITIPGRTFASLIGSVAPTVSTDATRWNISQVWIEQRHDYALAVSTDGHRLTRAVLGSRDDKDDSAPDVRQIPCLAALVAAARIPKKGPAPSVKLHEHALQIGGLVVRWSCNATFPPYEQVIPRAHSHEIELHPTALLAKLRGILTKAGDIVVLESPAPGTLRASLFRADVDASIEHPCAVTGIPRVGLNGSYLCDALALFTDTIVIRATNDVDPLVLYGNPDRNGCDTTIVLMPYRI